MRPFDYPIAALVIIGLIVFFVRGRQTRAQVPAIRE